MNESVQTTGTGSQDRRGRAFERVVLVAVLLMQVLILAVLVRGYQPSTAGLAPAPNVPLVRATAGTEPAEPPVPPPILSVRALPAAQQQAQQAMRAFAQMDAFFEQTFSEMAAMDRLFDRDAGWDAIPVSPFLDMREEGDRYVVVYAAPGLTARNVDVVLDGRILTIAATLPHRHGERGAARPFMVERHVQLPGPVGGSPGATAVITNGILRIALPKAAPTPALDVQPVRLF